MNQTVAIISLIGIVSVFIAGYALARLRGWMRSMEERIEKQDKRMNELNEELKRMRHTHPTIAVEATWESILNAPAGSGTNVIVVNQAPSGLAAHSSWVVIDPFTDECEIRKVIGVSDEEIELAAELGYEHTVSDLVLFVMAPVCNVKWWGAKGDGSTDDTTAIQRATTQAQLLGGTSSPNVFDFGTVYLPAGFYYRRIREHLSKRFGAGNFIHRIRSSP